MSVKQKNDCYIAHMYARYPIVLSHGKGCFLYDEEGKQYLDLTAGIGVTSLGHAYKPWVDAITKQAASLAHVSNLYYTKPDSDVAAKLCERTGFKKMMFANSGAEANEGAIKTARKYSFDKYGQNRYEIITLVNSFHGRTITSLSATGQDTFHTFFDPFTPGFQYAIANDLDDLNKHISTKTCAIMIELIQGEGGVLPLDKGYVCAVAEICKTQDILLIVDEVQTGIGRTGTLYAYEQFGIKPDIVTTAKGLGGGLPIGGVLLNDKCADTMQPGQHGTTFGGNPVACAGANVVLDCLDEGMLLSIQEKGIFVKERLLQMPHVTSVDGLGLMFGILLEDINVKELVLKCMEDGLLVLTAKEKLRLLPPLTITKEELTMAMNKLEDILKKWRVDQ